MNREEFQNWVTHKVENQQKLTLAAMVAMVGLGLFVLLVQGGILYLLISWGYGPTIAILFLLALFGGMGLFTWSTAPRRLTDSKHTVDLDEGKLRLRVAPTMSNVWTFAMGSLDGDQSIFEKIFGLLMLVPRMFWTAWYAYKRWQRLQEVDVPSLTTILRILFRKSKRVEVETLASKRADLDLPRSLYEASLLDGVVFLTKQGVGISLAPRLTDDLAKWQEKGGGSTGDSSSFFDD